MNCQKSNSPLSCYQNLPNSRAGIPEPPHRGGGGGRISIVCKIRISLKKANLVEGVSRSRLKNANLVEKYESR